jgi:multiple sugar transport system permease protein
MNFDYKNTKIVRRLTNILSGGEQQFGSLFGFLLFLPSLLLIMGLFLFPMGYIFYLSFFEIGIFATDGIFIGAENYITILSSPDFHSAVLIGIVFAIGSVAFQLILGVGIALLVNRSFFGASIARTLAIFPYLVPIIAVVIMWQWLLNPIYGAVNQYAVLLGVIEEPIEFFSHISLALPSVIVTSSWKFIAFASLIILARLQSIDDTQYEQAKICGASMLQTFREVTLPNLRSAILLVIFLRSIFMFNKFAAIWLFTAGGPLSRTTNLPIYIYQTTFLDFELGRGSATAIILFSLLIVFATFYFWNFKPSEEIDTV